APQTGLEQQIADLWAEVLRVERVGRHDSFFSWRGPSLLATQVISRIRNAFQTEVPLRAMFEAPTVAELAQQIETLREEASGVPALVRFSRESVLPLSFSQQRLWFIHQLEPDSPAYN